MKAIKSPLLTEKSALGMNNGLYVFSITQDANKITIAKELKELYNVDAVSVNIVNLPAKKVNFRRIKGERPARRKAYVQLKAKQSIPGFEGIKDEVKKSTESLSKDKTIKAPDKGKPRTKIQPDEEDE